MRATRLISLLACLTLAACGLPRGAGFQSEVLAASNANTAAEGEAPVYDFAVYEVTRETLPVIAGWPSGGPASMPWLRAQEQPASLLIAPGDAVQLTIWDAEENSLLAGTGQRTTQLQTAVVSSDGRIFVPYIGELRIAGMSPSTARERIEEELVRTIPSAQVQLVVEPGRLNPANLASGDAAPGLYPLPDRNFTLLDLFSQAGGPTPDVVSPQVRLVRDGRTFGIPFDRLLTTPSLNPTVQGGDRIYVEDDDRKFMTLGATGSQSIFSFPEEDLSALEALSLIGGVNGGTANPEAVLILREYAPSAVSDGISGPPQERVVFTIDLTSADGLFSAGRFMLEGDDLIYGTESVLGPALTLFGLTNTVSSLAPTN
ncbi:MAG: polysaccharide biosynthesis/export family protein [Pseudomonadota bacterium]